MNDIVSVRFLIYNIFTPILCGSSTRFLRAYVWLVATAPSPLVQLSRSPHLRSTRVAVNATHSDRNPKKNNPRNGEASDRPHIYDLIDCKPPFPPTSFHSQSFQALSLIRYFPRYRSFPPLDDTPLIPLISGNTCDSYTHSSGEGHSYFYFFIRHGYFKGDVVKR